MSSASNLVSQCMGIFIIALGDKRWGTPYSYEDREFIAALADQATITLDNLMMEERILESRQMESFNRFSSFVIHDLKNMVGMLSLTAENARANIANEDFQQDLIMTLKRSVEKMESLISSLSAFKPSTAVRRTGVDAVRPPARFPLSSRRARRTGAPAYASPTCATQCARRPRCTVLISSFDGSVTSA